MEGDVHVIKTSAGDGWNAGVPWDWGCDSEGWQGQNLRGVWTVSVGN